MHKTQKSRTAIPGYTLIPDGDHYKIRKIGNSGERVKNDPAYHNTRLHNEAFKKAARMGRHIRYELLRARGYKNNPASLTGALLNVLATSDAALHERSFATADFTGMNEFNLNDEVAWDDCMKMKIDALCTPRYGTVTVFLPGFSPADDITAPEGITHLRINTTVLFVHLEWDHADAYHQSTTILPLKNILVRPQTIIAKSKEKMSNGVWLVAMSVTWYQPTYKEKEITVSKQHGPLIIVKMGNF